MKEAFLVQDLSSFFSLVWRKGWVLGILNWLFFCFIFVGVLLEQVGVVQVYAWPFGEIFPVEAGDALLTVVVIFIFNLVLSGFVLVTLTGLGFFGVPLFFLCFRAFLWGTLLSGLSTPMFLAVLPTLILEGEGYVFAALAGVNLGLSWIRPRWAYEEEKLSRFEAVKKALRDCLRIYVLVTLILFVASVVETITLIFI